MRLDVKGVNFCTFPPAKMSVICITSHDESIYESTKPPVCYKSKKPNFSSRYNHQKRSNEHMGTHHSMGVPETDPPDPKDYLKKGHGIKPPQAKGEHPPKTPGLPPIPKKDECLEEQDNKLKHKRKDFINRNIWKVHVMRPPAVKPHGIHSYLKSAGYGKTPPYLNKIMKNREKYMQSKKDTVGLYQPICKYITRDEREQLLEVTKNTYIYTLYILIKGASKRYTGSHNSEWALTTRYATDMIWYINTYFLFCRG